MRERKTDLPYSGLGSIRLRTGLAIALERLWPLCLPFIIVGATATTLAWVGLFRSVPDALRYAIMAILGIVSLLALLPLRRFTLPEPQDINARIEAENRLIHQPLTVQADKPAGDAGEVAQAFWREHQARMARQLENLQGASPRPKTHEHDQWALRALPALSLAIAFGFSLGPYGGRISDLWTGQAALPAIPPRIDAWITPPRYTGKPPVFLTNLQDGSLVTVPENSELTVRIGSESRQVLSLYADGKPLVTQTAPAPVTDAKQPPSGQVLTAKLTTDIAIGLGTEAGLLKAWQFAIIADNPPQIAFSGDPAAAKNGTTTLAYTAKDDYGLVKGVARFELQSLKPGLKPLYKLDDLALSLPRRNSADGAAKTSKDLTQHPLAGEEFAVRLEVEDGAEQKSSTDAKTFVLPEYRLVHPLARALAENRRLLARDSGAKPLVLDLLDALTIRPDETIANASHFLGVETARIRLKQAQSDEELRSVVAYLWEVALAIDKNALSDAERRLQQAQDRLEEALKNGASNEEIEKLMQELRQAMNEYMKELAQDVERNPQNAQEQGEELSSSDLEDMLQKMEDLAKQGSRDQARELLNQLRDMMNNLQAGRGKSGKGGQGKSEMEGRLNELGKMLREQQQLLDETFQRDRDRFNPGDQGQGEQGQNGQGQNGEGQSGRGQNGKGQSGSGLGGLQERQNGLAGRLEGLQRGLKELGIEPGPELGEAGRAMGQAGKDLGEGDTSGAVGEQRQALDSLRKGAEGLMEQMRQAMGEGGGGTRQSNRGADSRDPLGRPNQTQGPDFGQSVTVPDEIDIQRAREILDAIRKRLGNALSPELERQYLERLLNFD